MVDVGILSVLEGKIMWKQIEEIEQFDLAHGYVDSITPVFTLQKKRYYPPRADDGKSAPMSHRGGAIYKSHMQERWR